VIEAASARRGVPLEWSFALDALQLERDQAVTLDTTRVHVRTPRRELIIIDCPGHRELVRNLSPARLEPPRHCSSSTRNWAPKHRRAPTRRRCACWASAISSSP
jgi:hypothetical protein